MFNKKVLITIGIVFLFFVMMGGANVSSTDCEFFVLGLFIGGILIGLYERSSLKGMHESFDDLDRQLSSLSVNCFVTQTISEDYTEALIRSLEERVAEFKWKLEGRREKTISCSE